MKNEDSLDEALFGVSKKEEKSLIGARMDDFDFVVAGEESSPKGRTEKSNAEKMLERVREILSENSPPHPGN
jgi:hypothetical protein